MGASLETRLRFVNHAFVALAAAVSLGTALREAPRPLGDAPEYMLLTQSLHSHRSAELRAEDLDTVTRQFLDLGVLFPPGGKLIGYYEAEDGRRYGYHFWAYSLLCLPAKMALRAAGGCELKALQLTNAILMALALGAVALLSSMSETQKLLWNALSFLSPAAWFILWPHPEVFSFALVTVALLAAERGWGRTALACASIGALQNPQIMLLTAYFWMVFVVRARARVGGAVVLHVSARVRDALTHALAAVPFLAHPAFFYAHFGTFSVVAREATSLTKVSVSRALGLLFDLNVGLLPYIPLAVVAYLGFVLWHVLGRRFDRQVQLFLVFVAMLLVNTLQWNYNHGTSGPSRYVIWMMPLVFVALAEEARSQATIAIVALAVAAQAGVLWSRGGLIPRYDYLQHSPQAAFVLDNFPSLYNPDYDVFIKRTLHEEGRPTRGPYAYLSGGQCRKVLASQEHRAEIVALCGSLPEGAEAFFDQPPRKRGQPRAWAYLNY
jgi:hypothetical protein